MMNRAMTIFTIVAGLLAGGCTSNDSAEVKAELDMHLAEATTIYHGGCNQLGACDLADRACEAVADSIITDLNAGSPAILEWESPEAVVGIRTYYYVLQPDGSGSFFSESRTDIGGSDCGDYCGWHRENFDAKELFDGNTLRLAPSGREITDFALCGWP